MASTGPVRLSSRSPIRSGDLDHALFIANEVAAERKLTAQVLSFFVSMRERSGLAPEFADSFENSWTATPREVETTVPTN